MSGRKQYTTAKVVAVALTLIAVFSPLYIDRKPAAAEQIELEDEPTLPTCWQHLLIVFLIISIVFSSCLDQKLVRTDRYWVHRAGGSPAGIIAFLLLLALVVKIKAHFPQ